MKKVRTVLAVAGFVAISTLMLSSVFADQTETVKVPTFGQVVVYRPDKPTEVVLFISGDGGWNKGVVSMAERLRDLGALVVGIDIRTFNASMRQSKRCAYPAGALEQLSRDIQLRYKLPAYIHPMLVGYSSGATLVYAALAAAPPETFAGGLSLGFCPDLDEATPMCQMRGLKTTRKSKGVGYDLSPYPGLQVPWMVLHGESDQVCSPEAARAFVNATGSSRLFSLPKVGHGFGVPANWEPQFVDAYRALVATTKREVPHVSIPEAGDLPLIEVPATVPSTRNEMAVIVSGDGGWAELDKSVAQGLAGEGVPTVGLNSLRYFWTPRTPETAAADLARVITHYSSAWHRDRVILIGYSFGADVLPFLINKLEPSVRVRIANVALLGLGTTAEFEFHLAEWLGQSGGPEYSTAPEVDRLTVPITCVRGADEDDSACGSIKNPRAHVVTVGEGHHFGGEYERLVNAILANR